MIDYEGPFGDKEAPFGREVARLENRLCLQVFPLLATPAVDGMLNPTCFGEKTEDALAAEIARLIYHLSREAGDPQIIRDALRYFSLVDEAHRTGSARPFAPLVERLAGMVDALKEDEQVDRRGGLVPAMPTAHLSPELQDAVQRIQDATAPLREMGKRLQDATALPESAVASLQQIQDATAPLREAIEKATAHATGSLPAFGGSASAAAAAAAAVPVGKATATAALPAFGGSARVSVDVLAEEEKDVLRRRLATLTIDQLKETVSEIESAMHLPFRDSASLRKADRLRRLSVEIADEIVRRVVESLISLPEPEEPAEPQNKPEEAADQKPSYSREMRVAEEKYEALKLENSDDWFSEDGKPLPFKGTKIAEAIRDHIRAECETEPSVSTIKRWIGLKS